MKAPKKSLAKNPKSEKISSPFTNYFKIGDIVLIGKFNGGHGSIVGFGEDKWGNPTVEIEPIPKE